MLSPSQTEQIYRRNFLYFFVDGILFSVAMGIIGSTTLIPDFVSKLTDSKILIGFSGTMFEVGWLLPQLIIARYIIGSEHKKNWFLLPNIPVRFVMLIFAGIIVLLGEGQRTAILIAFLICYGIAAIGDGVVGIPWWDLMGTSMDNRWRARFFGGTSALTALIMLAISPLIGYVLGDSGPDFPNNYALLFAASGILFVISIIPIIYIQELPGGKPVEKIPTLGEFLPQLGEVLRTDAPFRAMIIVRMFSTLFVMASPFYVVFAKEDLGLSSGVAVPRLLAMQTIGMLLGSMLYSWMGAQHNLLFIRMALGTALLVPMSALLAGMVGPLPLYLGFLVAGLTLTQLFSAFSNWVVMYATAEQRPVYAGLFNSVTAGISLTAPFIAGTIAGQLGYEALFGVAILMGCCALFVTLRYVV